MKTSTARLRLNLSPRTQRVSTVEQWLDVSCLQGPSIEQDNGGQNEAEAHAACKIVTANRLSDGVPIYFTASRSWSRNIAEALRVTDTADILAEAQTETQTAISPYVIDVAVMNGRVRPVGLREEIRAFGPTA
jgi:hypothetical protein